MIIRLPAVAYRNGQDRFPLLYQTDHHWGDADCDKALLKSELDWAREHDARVFWGGDTFALILPKDSKRYDPSRYAPEIAGTDAVQNAALDSAVRFFGPYADLIDVVGDGNHEAANLHHHSVDLIALLVERLQVEAQKRRPGHRIWRSGYQAGIVLPFRRKTGGGVTWRTYFHHGWGGSAPVTRGMIDFARAAANVGDCDCIWMGHKHSRGVYEAGQYRFSADAGADGPLKATPVWYVRTGAYTNREEQPFDGQGLARREWETERGFPIQGRGGVKVWLRVTTPRIDRPGPKRKRGKPQTARLVASMEL